MAANIAAVEPPECGIKFTDAMRMKYHENWHKGSLDTVCKECDNHNYRDPWSLKTHIKRVHLGEKNFSCEKCSFRAFNIHKLVNHEKMVHSNTLESCSICKNEVKSMYHHMRSKHSDTPEAYENYKKIQKNSRLEDDENKKLISHLKEE